MVTTTTRSNNIVPVMDSDEQWPSLVPSRHQEEEHDPQECPASPSSWSDDGEQQQQQEEEGQSSCGDDWQVVVVSSKEEDGSSSTPPPVPSKNESFVLPTLMIRQRSLSVPDLQLFDNAVALECVSEEESVALSSIKDNNTSTNSVAWGNGVKKVPSFRDIIVQANQLHSNCLTKQQQQETSTTTKKKLRNRVKPKLIVVTPPTPAPKQLLRRSSKSMGDLQAFFGSGDEEYYHRKAKGVAGRQNGLKLRPDEAKRKEISVHKRALQRQRQQRKQRQ